MRYLQTADAPVDYVPYDSPVFEVILMSGLPGAGKDSFIRKHFTDLPVISLDDIREEWKVAADDRTANGRVIQEAKERAKILLRRSQGFVWNATNISSPDAGTVDRIIPYISRSRSYRLPGSALPGFDGAEQKPGSRCSTKSVGAFDQQAGSACRLGSAYSFFDQFEGIDVNYGMIINKTININAPASRVWEALTTPSIMKRWMTDAEMDIISDFKTGSAIVVTGNLHGIPYENKGTILQCEPSSVLKYNYWSSLSQHDDIPGELLTYHIQVDVFGRRYHRSFSRKRILRKM